MISIFYYSFQILVVMFVIARDEMVYERTFASDVLAHNLYCLKMKNLTLFVAKTLQNTFRVGIFVLFYF